MIKTALELVGGGAKGIVTAGALKYMVAKGVNYDAVFATSSGALNCAFLGMGDIELLEWLWLNLKTKDVMSLAPWRLFTKDACIWDSSPLYRTLLKHIDIDKLRANPKMHVITLTDFVKMEPSHVLLNNEHYVENVCSYLLASCSIPVAFPPVHGKYYDGGVMDNYNAGHALDLNFKNNIIIFPSVATGFRVNSLKDAIDISITLPGCGNYRSIKSRFTTNITEVKPDANGPKLSILDFDYKGYERKALIQYGYDMAKRVFEK